jgi:hypothetical protein
VTQPANGSVVITGGGASLTYQPNPNYCNTPPGTTLDSFSYTLAPGASTATVSVTVNCVDDNPVAVNDAATLTEDAAATSIDVLANDTDSDGGAISITSVSQPTNGSVVITGGGAGLTYQPNPNYCNTPPGTTLDSFSYTLAPGASTATVAVTVNCVDDAPLAVNDTTTLAEDAPASAIDVLANDSDIDGGPKSITSVTQPTNGSVVITGGGTGLTYQPDPNYCNTPPGTTLDSFSYTLAPGASTATVAVTVTCVNDPPVADNDSFDFIGNTELRIDLAAASTPHTLETTPSTLGVLDGDSDPVENDPISVSAIVGCADAAAPYVCPIAGVGTVTMQANGRFSILPDAGDTAASETFQYTLSDGMDTVNATVTLNRFERVWYVKNSAPAGGLGRAHDPFDTLAEAQAASLANDYIFVYFGDGTTTGQAGGIALKNGQHLIGEHAGLSIPVNLNANGSPTNLVAAAPGSRPLLNDTLADAVEGVSATNAIPVEIVGLNLAGNVNAIDWTTTAAFSGSGTLTIRDNLIRSAAADGIDLNLAGTGSLNLAFHDNNLTSTGSALDIQETGSGSLTITAFDDNVVSGSTAGSGININTATFDATPGAPFNTVSGGATVIGASGDGVGGSGMVLANVSGDLNFADLDIFADAGAGLRVSGIGAGIQLAVTPAPPFGSGSSTIEATGGPAVDISSATINLQLSSLKSTNSASTGVSLDTVGGAFSSGAASSITNATGTDFNINAGTANVTYNGTITDDIGQLVSVANTTGGTKTFAGVITDGDDGDGSGISLTSNTGATITFSGGVTLSTGANPAFTATGGGTLNVCNENPCNPAATGGLVNKLTTTTGMALNVTNTTIGANKLEFRSISSNGGLSTGIILDTTGSSGGLTVTGNGTAGSGGTIANKTGGDGSTTTGTGIYLNNTSNISLAFMQINDHQNFGIFGTNVNNFTLANSVVNGANGTNPTIANYGEGSIYFGNAVTNGLTGSASITNSSFSGGRARNFSVVNTSGTLNRLTITGSSFGLNQNSVDAGDSLSVEARNGGTVLNATVTGSTFTGAPGDLAEFVGQTGTTMDVIFQNNTLSNNHPNNIIGGGGVTLGTQGVMTFNVTGNSLRGANGSAITLQKASAGTTMSGTLDNNTIGASGAAGSGSMTGNGIFLSFAGGGAIKLAITNNNIRQYNGNAAIFADNTGGTYAADFTITGNTAAEPGIGAFAGLALAAGAPLSADNIDVCAKIGGLGAERNDFSAGDPANANDVILGVSTGGSSIRLPGYAGATLADVQNFVLGNNFAGTAVTAYVDPPATAANFTGGAACALPPLLAAGGEGPGATNVTQAELALVAAEAIARWEASSISTSDRAKLAAVSFALTDLEPGHLGGASATSVLIDRDAAGWGWFVDTTPADDAEFTAGQIGAERRAGAGSPAHGRMDLLTVAMHELGHVLGHDDIASAEQPHTLMADQLPTGARRSPAGARIAQADIQALAPAAVSTTPSSVQADVGMLPAGKRVIVIFDVLIAAPVPQGVSSINNQASVSGGNFATLLTDDPATATAADPTNTALDVVKKIYLPLMLQSVAQTPDLVVTSVTLSPNKASFTTSEQVQISVVIKNQGNAPTTPFWVDLYLNPSRTPALNLIWSQVCSLKPCYGIAWQISQPLAPGAELTLTSTVGSYAPSYTNWRDRLAAGTTDLYVQADSWNPGKNVGASGDANLPNNLIHISGLRVTGQNLAGAEPAVVAPARPPAQR